MKNIRNTGFLFATLLGGALLFTGCREDEKLNLPGYPESSFGISIAGTEDNATTVTVSAAYNNKGKIVSDSPIAREYIFAVTKASPEDVVLQVEPFFVNIPEDKVTISTREIRIPAGAKTSEPVVVGLVNDDFSFVEPNQQAQTYELGLRVINADGYNMSPDATEAKVIINKEAYVANLSIVGAEGNIIDFGRVYRDGGIINEDKMEYSFKVQIDKPVSADLKVKFTTTGLSDPFMKDLTVAPAEVTIPAGKTESDEIKWSLTDDFLLTTTEEETHTLVTTATFECADPTVKPVEGETALTFVINKVFNPIRLVDAVNENWAAFDRSGWSATGAGGYGSPENVLDDSSSSDYYGSGATLWIAIDMKEVKRMVGFSIQYYGTSYVSKKIILESSMDGVSWTEIGTMEDLPKVKTHYFQFMIPQKANFVKLTSTEKYGSYHDISIVKVYGSK